MIGPSPPHFPWETFADHRQLTELKGEVYRTGRAMFLYPGGGYRAGYNETHFLYASKEI